MSTELKPGETDKLWTISNIITLVRICLVPVFVVALITPLADLVQYRRRFIDHKKPDCSPYLHLDIMHGLA